MLFGDEKRFQKTYVANSIDTRIHGVKAVSTEETVGPGSYFTTNLDLERNGWMKKSFSRRQPMTPPAKYSVFGRNDSFTTGVLTSYGAMSAPKSPRDVLNSPGPGYYDRNVFNFANSRVSPNGRTISTPRSSPRNSRPHSANNSVAGLSQQSIPLSTSKRFLFDHSATLKDGVLFLSSENNYKDTGPGYYSFNLDTLNKPSHNVRAKSPAPSPRRAVVSVGTPRSSQSGRPRSASSGRLRNY